MNKRKLCLIVFIAFLTNVVCCSCNNVQAPSASSTSPSVLESETPLTPEPPVASETETPLPSEPPVASETETPLTSEFPFDSEYPMFYCEDGQWYFDPGIKAEELPDITSLNMNLEFENYDEFLKMLRAEELTKDQRAIIGYIHAFAHQIKENGRIMAPNPYYLEKCSFLFEPEKVEWGSTLLSVYTSENRRGETKRVMIYETPMDLEKPNNLEATTIYRRTVYYKDYDDGERRYIYYAEHDDATVQVSWYLNSWGCMAGVRVQVQEKDGLSFIYYPESVVEFSPEGISGLENIRLTKHSTE